MSDPRQIGIRVPKHIEDELASAGCAPVTGSAAGRCVKWGCEDAALIWLEVGQSLQTFNGYLVPKVSGWYCPVCAGSYGARYLLCECVTCGWQDQFRQDYVKNQQATGYCDRCDAERTFNCIEPQNSILSDR